MTRTSTVLIAGALMLAGCSSLPGPAGGSGIGGACSGDFGAEASAQKLEAFMMASSRFTRAAADLEGSLKSACREMADQLEIPDSELQGEEGEARVQVLCNAVSRTLEAELASLRAEANLTISVQAAPPRCEVSMEAYGECAAECDANIEPGSVEVECEGGEISGGCTAECTGECSVEISGQCEGECSGSCSGGCSGTCQGTCDGECSATNADGSCNGTCSGTCEGTCSAGCQGSCEGECWVSGQASCSGECRGGCSVEYTEPSCSGSVEPPSMSAECEASCDAHVEAEASCEPGHVEVVIEGDLSGEIEGRANRLKGALRSGLGTIVMVRAKLERLGASGVAMVRVAGELPGAVADMGMQATTCVSQAAAALPQAAGQVSMSVEVSASVSASASGGT